MITLAAYGIRKAYKKQQARKAQKEQLERENGDLATISHFDGLRSTSSTSSYRQSPHQQRHPVDGVLVNYSSTTPSELTRVESPSPSSRTAYSGSVYSQKSYQDPMEEMRQYQAYVQRQSYDFAVEPDPPTYEYVVGQDAERLPWTSPFGMGATRTESLSRIRESRHNPQGPDRLVELDSSSESSPSRSHQVPLRLLHPRSPVHQTASPHTQLPAEYPEQIVGPVLDDELQASLDELVAEYPPPLNMRKSKEVERGELHEDEAQPQPLEAERPQLKRPRSESESEIESEDNEEVIVRFNVADRTKRPHSKRGSFAT
jgi:hypothetical protein